MLNGGNFARIERREYKYLVDDAMVARIRRAVRPFCELDSYGEGQPDRAYTINSLYFDTPRFSLFMANEHEKVDRFKLRMRSYPAYVDGPAFLEVKRRVNDVVLKTRGKIPQHAVPRLLDAPERVLSQLDGKNRVAVERFLSLVHTYEARPKTAVRYEREAWVSQVDHYARVTFDRRVRSQPQHDLALTPDSSAWRNMDHGVSQRAESSQTILELKFTSHVPRWMMHLVQSLDLMRGAFSKYGTSILAWYRAPNLGEQKMRRVY